MTNTNTNTNALIEQLSSCAVPVKRLASPARRTLAWLGMAVVIAIVVVASYGLRDGLLQAMAPAPAAIEWFASVATGVLAAYAVFQISVPGRSSAWAWLPLPAVLLWLGGLGWGCLQPGAAFTGVDTASAECAWAITLISLPLGLVLLLMVRHAGVVRPAATAMLAALSAAALAAAAVSLIHEGESAWMVLLWHVGAVALLSLLSWLFGRRLFGWIGFAPRGLA